MVSTNPAVSAVVALALVSIAAACFYRTYRNKRPNGHFSEPAKAAVPMLADPRDAIFRQLAESIQQVFWMADCRESRLIYVSPAMLDVWLIEPQIIINDPTQWFASIHPADRASAEETLVSMLLGVANSCEYRIIRPDGEIRAVRNRSFPVQDVSGTVTRVAGIIEDVTSERDAQRALRQSRDELVHHVNELKSENRERRRAEEQLRAAKDLAEAGSRAKSQFLRNISHELRTPLNGIIGMVQIALDAEDSKDQRECLQSAASSAAHLLAIVDDILEFSESETGRLEITPAPFQLRKCVRDVVKRMAPQVFEKQLEFAYFVSANVPETVVGDARRVAQILVHLVSNAVKFSNEGSVCLEVTRFADARNNPWLRFVVSDNGIGVARESRDAIFEAFTQADGSLTRSYGGLGLGLSICSRLVALMGGEMSLESEPGKGSRFGFTIPLESRTLSSDRANWNILTGQSVLVVDSCPANSHVAERSFREAGMKVTTCSEAQQALSELEKGTDRFVAVLMGTKLRDGSPFDLAARLCNAYGARDKLLLILDPENEQAQLAQARELQVGGHFTRPADYDEIRQSMVRLVPDSPIRRPKPQAGPKLIPVGPPLRVLLVEDNAINQIVLKRILQKHGHSVITADNGLVALEALEEVSWDVDVVLMDMQMPGLDGYETTARIRAQEQARGGHMPIVAVTAHAMAGDADRCLGAGMDAYVTKPIQMEVLAKAIAKGIASYRPVPVLERKVS